MHVFACVKVVLGNGRSTGWWLVYTSCFAAHMKGEKKLQKRLCVSGRLVKFRKKSEVGEFN